MKLEEIINFAAKAGSRGIKETLLNYELVNSVVCGFNLQTSNYGFYHHV